MGTRINVIMEHDLPDYRNRELVMARLESALPAVLTVCDYWRAQDPKYSHLDNWRLEPELSWDPSLVRYTGPGSIFLNLRQSAAHVRTGGRWTGFFEIEPLRRVHLGAFNSIARILGSRSVALFGDLGGEVWDVFENGGNFWQCVSRLEELLGPPHPSVERIDSFVGDIFRLWFLQDTKVAAEQSVALDGPA